VTQTIEFFYDLGSPYSCLALTRLLEIDVALALRPMKILEIIKKVGNVPTTITCAAKGRYARIDLGRWAQLYGIAFNPSDMRANDGNACSRAVLAAVDARQAAAISLALFRAIWSKGKTLANSAHVLAALTHAGIDSAPVAARIDSPKTGAALDANTDEAAERCVFGSPTMFVGEAMFFGNDRMDFVREELARLRAFA
jgi:2-hydroxychromene-2-carboxylate isomerase